MPRSFPSYCSLLHAHSSSLICSVRKEFVLQCLCSCRWEHYFFHFLAFVNRRLYCHRNMAEMTGDVIKMWFQRSIAGRGPAQLPSVGCFVGSVWMTVSLFLRSRLFSRNDHLDSVDTDGEANGSDRTANVYDDTCDGDEL